VKTNLDTDVKVLLLGALLFAVALACVALILWPTAQLLVAVAWAFRALLFLAAVTTGVLGVLLIRAGLSS
jgi:hypothetical protein